MSDVSDKRVPGQNHPHRDPSFPSPWRITTDVSGWFCPSDQWPEQYDEGEWPARDPDPNPKDTTQLDDEDGAE